MRVRVGTSGYAYKEWKGSFYPERLPAAKMLGFYAERFDTVEINGTYRRMPEPGVLEGWRDAAPSGFAFALKAPGQLTHLRNLAGLEDRARLFFDMATRTLGDRLGPILFQLPPYLKRDVETLTQIRRFFELVPAGVRIALEATDPSFHHEELYALLRERNAALCVVDDPKREAPLVATASWGYLRLRRVTYRKPALSEWAEKVRAQGWSEAWTFFKHEDKGTGPRLGARFKELLAPGLDG